MSSTASPTILPATGHAAPATIAKVTWRLLPFLLLMYVLAFLDRANVGFAKKEKLVEEIQTHFGV